MNKKLSELREQAQALGLTVVQKTAKPAKKDYVDVLRNHFIKRDYPQGVPFEEISPMLGFSYMDLKVPERENLWKDQNDWLAQEKHNGIRAVVHFVRGVGIFVHSRNLSLEHYRRTDLTPHLLFQDLVTDVSATVDCEIVQEAKIDTGPFTDGGSIIHPGLTAVTALFQMKPEFAQRLQIEQNAALRFKCFDIVEFDGRDLRRKKLMERLPYLGDFRAAVDRTPAGQFFDLVPGQLHSKRVFFDRILSRGGEGVVLKNLHSLYEDNSRRSRKGWIKVKKSVELDAFVSGFEPGKPAGRYKGKVATLLFSVHTEQGPHLIAKVSSLSKRARRELSVRDPKTKEIALVVHPCRTGHGS